eukprot:TRINITY_DN1412_c0_g1_i15.p1 TRINITY_DN1412_c0_g1~~TRINITY_DN1412_c0_g1_i15.p1  ORF type:complete len:749 (+),score=140.10 TRINITY_DN1412_c0_g1_i15:37-2283(+)
MESFFKLFYKRTDAVQEQRSKKILISMMLFVFHGNIAGLVFVSGPKWPRSAGHISGISYASLFLVKWFVTKTQTDFDKWVCLLASLVGLFALDIVAASEMREPVWPLAVLIVDAVLLCRMPPLFGKVIVSLVSFYLLFIAVERAARFGLYDIAGEKMRGLRECFNPTPEQLSISPCKQDAFYSASIAGISTAVFLLDFYCTRSFAVGMQREQEKLQASVSLAEAIVSDLVRFDLDAAEDRIASERTTALTEILSRLLNNLRQYRPYLPDSLFEEEIRVHEVVKAPSGPNAAVLFTDIKSSTALWEASPDAMKKALKMHNNIIRYCAADFRGYEVKTIGDSFMLAFSTFSDACAFAMNLQERLAETVWPSDLKVPSEFETNGWRGIVVRIGLHFGEVECEVGEVSGRTDYFGRTVNKAARLESVCVPGGVAIDHSLLDHVEIPPGWYHTETSKTLKGIDDLPVLIALLLHNKLAACPDAASRDTASVARSSYAGSVSSIGALTHHPAKAGLLSKRHATTCTVRMECREEEVGFEPRINAMLGKLILCAEMSEGSIVSLLSSSITIGWNTARSMSSHAENGLRFVSLMHSNITSSMGEIFMGISSGPVQCGRVGTKDQRFVTVFGSCVNMCGLLSQASFDIGAFALTTTTEHLPRQPFQRPVDRWTDKHNEPLIVCELHPSKLKDYLTREASISCSNMVITNIDEWGWSDDYWDAFGRCDWETVEVHQKDDLVLRRVVERMRKGSSFRGP